MNDQDAKKLFEDAVQGLDAAAGNRLRMARRSILAADGPRRARAAWMPALATAVVLGVGLAWWLPPASAPVAPAAVVAPASPEVAEFAEAGDEAELYAWLAEAPVAADQGEGSL